jgi:SAM-dependent methyltransferase
MVSSDVWGPATAARYDAESAAMFTDEVLTPTVDVLTDLAAGGAALEFAIGTGRVAVPLLRRGVPVSGIELSAPMLARLRAKVDAQTLPVVLGDMATATVPGRFSLVYLVFNSIANLRTQREQVACFRNAARHLAPGGRFLIELWVPPLRRMPPGQTAVPFEVSAAHLGFDTYDVVTQQCSSHHYWRDGDDTIRAEVGNFRYLWPAECDLMAELAGLTLQERVADWHRAPFTGDSESHVSVWRAP